MQQASLLFREGETPIEVLTTWMETAYARFAQLGIPLERLEWFTEDGPKGTRRLWCREIVPPKEEADAG